MKRLIASIVVLIIISCNNIQDNDYFTGSVEYAYTYASDSLNVDSLANVRPFKGILRYDTLNYQGKFISSDTNTNYYSGVLNKCLSQINYSGKYACEDYGIAGDSIVSYKIIDTDEKILGYRCKILEIQKKHSWLQYYFSDELKIAPVTYRRHAAYNWDFYGEKANGGLILKSEHRMKYFTLKGMATSLSRRNDNFKALEIDEGLFSNFCN